MLFSAAHALFRVRLPPPFLSCVATTVPKSSLSCRSQDDNKRPTCVPRNAVLEHGWQGRMEGFRYRSRPRVGKQPYNLWYFLCKATAQEMALVR